MLRYNVLGTGVDVYHVICWLFIFSFMGWLVESIYMSICNKKWTNRGFMFGPFCPIYGVGATAAYFFLRHLEGNYVLIYIVSAVTATIFEYLVAKLMIYQFGDFWWDYHDKPFNYKGILCLESTLAWGLYGVLFMAFIYDGVNAFIDMFPKKIVLGIVCVIFAIETFDFAYHFLKAKDYDVPESVAEWRELMKMKRK